MIQFFEDWVFIISKFYCQKNTIQPYELSDLRQFINFRLLEQLPKIKANYKGQSSLRTYISSIILNLCREFRKKNCSKSILTQFEINSELHHPYNDANLAENQLALENETNNLNNVISMYGSKASKIRLTLKMYYGLKTTRSDILNYCKDAKILTLSTLDGYNEEQLNKNETLTILTELFNEVEGKSNSTEATRKWVSRLIEDILRILNLRESNHTKETLGLLLETSLTR